MGISDQSQPLKKMPTSFGVRARTRDLFSRAFRQKGPNNLSNYLTTYRVGDIVDIKVNGSVHKGMPFKYYHGKTGRVWNITKRAVGVEVNKLVRGRIMRKRLHVRVEHIKKSRCREAFVERVKRNDQAKRDAKAAGKRIDVRRKTVGPRPGVIVKATEIETMRPLPYEFVA